MNLYQKIQRFPALFNHRMNDGIQIIHTASENNTPQILTVQEEEGPIMKVLNVQVIIDFRKLIVRITHDVLYQLRMFSSIPIVVHNMAMHVLQ